MKKSYLNQEIRCFGDKIKIKKVFAITYKGELINLKECAKILGITNCHMIDVYNKYGDDFDLIKSSLSPTGKRSVIVRDDFTNKVYQSMVECAKDVGVSPSAISWQLENYGCFNSKNVGKRKDRVVFTFNGKETNCVNFAKDNNISTTTLLAICRKHKGSETRDVDIEKEIKEFLERKSIVVCCDVATNKNFYSWRSVEKAFNITTNRAKNMVKKYGYFDSRMIKRKV